MGETHEIPHHNLADFEPCLGYATEGKAFGGIPLQNTLESPQYHPQPHPLHSTAAYWPSCHKPMLSPDPKKKRSTKNRLVSTCIYT
ncbi:hypothetical protein JHK82_018879 [Glycine max]|nr:hypothetical protein JHK82_018879 [Glycine max]